MHFRRSLCSLILPLLIPAGMSMKAAASGSSASGEPVIPPPPGERILRPTTLAPGAVSWRSEWAIGWAQRPGSSAESFFSPWRFEHGLSDRVTLVWSPFPFGIRVAVLRSPLWDAAVEFELVGEGSQYERHFAFRPSLSGEVRRRLGDSPVVALEADWLAQLDVDRMGAKGLGWTLGTFVGPWVQVSPRLAVLSGLGVFAEKNVSGGRYIGPSPVELGEPGAAENVRIRFPVQAALSWRLVRHWEAAIRWEWHTLGYESVSERHQISLSLQADY